ncbi:MAG: hypothetical protein A4E40_01480 [Methanoregulaceae archaeon PtaU1.Bin059]|nr:MAG: hypothetical protein A4E40_01480 [Methanoregulaceae archaeon PtaU1.Bin059]
MFDLGIAQIVSIIYGVNHLVLGNIETIQITSYSLVLYQFSLLLFLVEI